ncbi:MAG: MerR family transcriptional regulator [Spirochaetales bacterium]
MAKFSIGEVESITGVKTHTLRYWEEVIPSFSPEKTVGGRRFYTNTDVQIILRLKYLIDEKKFTIEGARNQLIEESSLPGSLQVLIPELHIIRSELLDVYASFRSLCKGKTS